TGAVGLELHKKGFTNIDALEPSEGMLNILKRTEVYSLTYQEFISQNPTTISEGENPSTSLSLKSIKKYEHPEYGTLIHPIILKFILHSQLHPTILKNILPSSRISYHPKVHPTILKYTLPSSSTSLHPQIHPTILTYILPSSSIFYHHQVHPTILKYILPSSSISYYPQVHPTLLNTSYHPQEHPTIRKYILHSSSTSYNQVHPMLKYIPPSSINLNPTILMYILPYPSGLVIIVTNVKYLTTLEEYKDKLDHAWNA
ncbi:guanine nucleotide exchange factor subunit RIC1-like, partial [Procambarus clarkii]|uniref:guanine nucleotide exchange factor subunit RIC1-like n=1 Tax=Procambarus clarkii TaxID=6728 RepID=UPI003743DC59